MSAKRAATIELYHTGKTNSEIVKLLKATRLTVSGARRCGRPHH